MRIVGGKFKGRDLVSPNDFRVRPTAEAVRSWMLDQVASSLKGARVLDLFAGTGAIGLEAMSRGARSCDFVETRPSSLHALKANIALLRQVKFVRVFKRDALPFAGMLGPDSYEIVFVDPPYDSKMLDRVIESWKQKRFSKILVAEHAKAHVLPKGKVKQVFEETAVTIYEQPTD